MRFVQINNLTHPLDEPIIANYANTFLRKFKGLMFQEDLRKNEGLLIVENVESRMNTAIHMFFMRFDIAVIWIDANYSVVDNQFARMWHPFYAPRKPAQMVLEIHPEHLNHFRIGDRIIIQHV